MLPLFPLGTVLFPGLVLPLHIFEQRYRDLARDLMDLPEDERRFGVVAIREGREAGVDGITSLHEVGCTARVTELEAYDDGRYDVVTVGADRFRLTELHSSGSYFTGSVEWLPDELGNAAEAEVLARAVAEAYATYLGTLGRVTGQEIDLPDLPDDPLVLSHLVGATMLLDLADRQDLLAQEDGRHRLRRELTLLRREGTFLQVLTAAPAPELARGPVSPN